LPHSRPTGLHRVSANHANFPRKTTGNSADSRAGDAWDGKMCVKLENPHSSRSRLWLRLLGENLELSFPVDFAAVFV
jgi:hypothetical protein